MYGRTFASVLDACAASYPHRIAVVDDGETLGYSQFVGDVRALGRGFRSRSLNAGDRVAVLMRDGVDLARTMYAALWAGLTVVPLNARLAPADLGLMLADCGARALCFDRNLAESAEEILTGVEIPHTFSTSDAAILKHGMRLSAVASGQSRADSGPADVDPEQPAFVIYTGGTTGRPKGVIHSQRTMLSAMFSYALEGYVDRGTIHAHVAPMTHAGLIAFLPVLMRGGTNVLLGGFDPQRLIRTIERERITSTMLVPTMLSVLLEQPELARADLSSLHTLRYGASPISVETLQSATAALGPVLVQAYGQTEAYSQISLLSKEDHLLIPDRPELALSCGRPVSISEVRIFGTDGRPIATGEVGEIVLRGPHIMLGYHDRPQETEDAFVDGWLRTGDLGRFDDEGLLYISGRLKDMIITGGFNVYPTEVERALNEHPAVRASCVFGVPDAKWGEAAHAIVVLEPGAQADPDEITRFVRQRKGGVLTPKRISIADAVPLTSVGKPDRGAARRLSDGG